MAQKLIPSHRPRLEYPSRRRAGTKQGASGASPQGDPAEATAKVGGANSSEPRVAPAPAGPLVGHSRPSGLPLAVQAADVQEAKKKKGLRGKLDRGLRMRRVSPRAEAKWGGEPGAVGVSPPTRSRDLVGSEHGATLPITGIAPQVPGHWKHERPHHTARVSETKYKGRPRSGWGRPGGWRVSGGCGGVRAGVRLPPREMKQGYHHAETDSGEQVTIERVYERVHS